MSDTGFPLGIYTRYARSGASSRLRFFMYDAALRAAGFDPRFHPFFDDGYLRGLYSGAGKSRLAALKAGMNRFFRPLEKILYIEYEMFPGLPAGVELSRIGLRPFVLNFDDAVWVKYRKLPLLRGKFHQLARRASGIIAANDRVIDYFRNDNPEILKVPTVIDLDKYPREVPKFPRFTVVWIGTPVTSVYLAKHAEALRCMARAADFELLVIGAPDFPEIPGVAIRREPWSEETEAELLARSHVGIMPLGNDEFSRGKSAYKLIQYCGAGIPAIASPVGENLNVVLPGETGFFADRPQEWASSLLMLQNDPWRLGAMSEAARRRAEPFSLRRYGSEVGNFLRRMVLA